MLLSLKTWKLNLLKNFFLSKHKGKKSLDHGVLGNTGIALNLLSGFRHGPNSSGVK